MQRLSNFGTTTLSITMLSTDTSGILTSGSDMPSSGDFVLLIESEYIYVTSISGGNIVFTRGYGGTTAVLHAAGVAVKLVLSKEVLLNYFAERVQVGGYASRPTSNLRAGMVYYANDLNAAWYYDGSNWNLYHPVYVPYANRVNLSGWTAVNQSTSTWTDTNGITTLGMPGVGGVDALRLFYKALPTAPYKINLILVSAPINDQYSGAGLGLYNSSNGKIATFLNFNNGALQSMSVDKYNSTTSFASTQVRYQAWGSPIWMQIEDDNTNWTWRHSFDGVHYVQQYQEARNTFVTPDKVCIISDRTENSGPDMEYYQFLAYWEQ